MWRLRYLMLFVALLPASAYADSLINAYTFDNGANLGQDSVGTRDMSQINIGGGATVSQVSVLTDKNGLTRNNVLRIDNEVPHNPSSNTSQGSYFRNDLGGSTPLSNFTVALWMNTDVNDNDGFSSFFSNGPSNHFQIDNGTNSVNPDDIRLLGQSGISHNEGSLFETDKWFHLAVTYDGTDTKFFVDGSELFSSSANVGNQFQIMRIGSNRGQSRLFDGLIDDLLVFDFALTEEEINALMVAVPEPTSIAIWSLLGLGLTGLGYYRIRRKK